MNVQEIYQEAFEDELQKIAKYSDKEEDEFAAATRKWEDEVDKAQRVAPKKHKFAPLMGAAAGTALGIGAAALSKTPFKFVGGLGGFIGGAALGERIIKNTPYGKTMDIAGKKYSEAAKATDKAMKLRVAKEKYGKRVGKIKQRYSK